MIVTLPPEAETKLREKARLVGQEADVFAGKLLMESLWEVDQSLTEDIAAIHEAMEDVRAGRERPYEDYVAARRLRFSDNEAA